MKKPENPTKSRERKPKSLRVGENKKFTVMINWINTKFGLSLSESDLSNVKDFSLIWSIFDRHVCNSGFSITRIEQKYSNMKFDSKEMEFFFDYFKRRYINDIGITNSLFDKLRLRRNDRPQFVQDVMLGKITDLNSKVLAITIIIYRYRNNFFHGLKDYSTIDKQDKNFEVANEFLKTIINKF